MKNIFLVSLSRARFSLFLSTLLFSLSTLLISLVSLCLNLSQSLSGWLNLNNVEVLSVSRCERRRRVKYFGVEKNFNDAEKKEKNKKKKENQLSLSLSHFSPSQTNPIQSTRRRRSSSQRSPQRRERRGPRTGTASRGASRPPPRCCLL